MRLLLDTHAYIWFGLDDGRLSTKARSAISSSDNEVFVSAASTWEMAIKSALGKLEIQGSLEANLQEAQKLGFIQLPIYWKHTQASAALPLLHNDPFDRLLAAQSKTENLSLVSLDPIFKKYGVKTLW